MGILDASNVEAVIGLISDPQYDTVHVHVTVETLEGLKHRSAVGFPSVMPAVGEKDAELGRNPERSDEERTHR